MALLPDEIIVDILLVSPRVDYLSISKRLASKIIAAAPMYHVSEFFNRQHTQHGDYSKLYFAVVVDKWFAREGINKVASYVYHKPYANSLAIIYPQYFDIADDYGTTRNYARACCIHPTILGKLIRTYKWKYVKHEQLVNLITELTFVDSKFRHYSAWSSGGHDNKDIIDIIEVMTKEEAFSELQFMSRHEQQVYKEIFRSVARIRGRSGQVLMDLAKYLSIPI